MVDRRISLVIALVITIALAGCASETQEPPTSAPVPNTPTPLPPTETPVLPTATSALPTARPTAPPIAIATLEEMLGPDMASIFAFRTDPFDRNRIWFDTDGANTNQGMTDLQIWFEDGFLHVTEDSEWCSEDELGIYEITGIPGQYVIFTIVDEPCTERAFEGKWQDIGD